MSPQGAGNRAAQPRLRLYVAGDAPNSRRAVANLRAACETLSGAGPIIEIVDVTEQPNAASDEGVFLTPTLVRLTPEPVLHLVGDLSEPIALLAFLQGG